MFLGVLEGCLPKKKTTKVLFVWFVEWIGMGKPTRMPPARSMTTTPGRCQRLTVPVEFVNEKMLMIVVLGLNIQVNNVYKHQMRR